MDTTKPHPRRFMGARKQYVDIRNVPFSKKRGFSHRLTAWVACLALRVLVVVVLQAVNLVAVHLVVGSMESLTPRSDFAVIGGAVESGRRSLVDPVGGRARRRHRSSPGSPEQAGASSASPARETDSFFWPVLWVAAPCLTTKLPCRGPRRCPRCAGALACPGCLRALVGFGMAS